MKKITNLFTKKNESASTMIDLTFDDQRVQDGRKQYERAIDETFGQPSTDKMFNFAITLVHSKNPSDIEEGINLLHEICSMTQIDQNAKRDQLYYIAIGYARLEMFEKALDTILHLQQTHRQGNDQIENMKEEIERRLNKDGMIGIGMAAGAAAVVVGGVAAVAAAVIARK
ncbi:hypothetical protein SNEBB_009407 [Seison nebaliae]|nr:hypothetical protein SNEBB_009407 [Seison nebaliae]